MFQPEVIIVEDNEIVQYLHREIVSMAGMGEQVPSFANGKDGLFYLYQRVNPNMPILVLLDINMPIMNGWEFLEALPKMTKNEKVHVAVVSSSIDNNDKVKASTYPHVIDFLEKPINEMQLIKLKEMISEQLTVSSNQ